MKARKLLLMAFMAIICVASLVIAGCGNNSSDSKLPSKIVIGLDDEFPPMGFRDEKGDIVGFDIDLAKETSKRLGIEVEFKPIDWDSKEAELKSKRIDVLWNGLTITEERKANILFSKPYLKGNQIIIVRNDSDLVNKDSLAGKNVAVQTGSSGEEAVKKDPNSSKLNIKEYGDFVAAFMDLKAGRVDAVVVDEMVGYYLMNKEQGAFKPIEGIYAQEETGVGMRKEDTMLKEAIDKTLDDMRKDGTMDKISTKWFGSTNPLVK